MSEKKKKRKLPIAPAYLTYNLTDNRTMPNGEYLNKQESDADFSKAEVDANKK